MSARDVGPVVQPHLGLAIDNSQGRLIQRIVQPAVGHVDRGAVSRPRR
jgi:hypothetical protein